MLIRKFYSTHSCITNPRKYRNLYEDLPDDISELCRILQNLILHYADASNAGYEIPHHRYREMDDRFVEVILSRIINLNKKSLIVKRAIDERVIGVCRDYAVLLCSILRHKKIPARLRSGFCPYFIPKFNLDSVCVEYWDRAKNKWCLVDARVGDYHVNKFKLDFDLTDLPLDKFIPAEDAWYACRKGLMKGNHFGSRHYRGLWYVRNRLLHELAFINKHEMLIWDLWGPMLNLKNLKPCVPEQDCFLLDRLTWLLRLKKRNLNELCRFYKNFPGLKVPEKISVFNPFFEEKFENVNL